MKDLAPESLRTRHTINSLMVRPVHVPMLSHQTASGEVTKSPLVPTDIVLGGGLRHSRISTYTRVALKPTAELLSNREPLPVGALSAWSTPWAVVWSETKAQWKNTGCRGSDRFDPQCAPFVTSRTRE